MFLTTFALNLLVHFCVKTSFIKLTLTNVPVITRYSGVVLIGGLSGQAASSSVMVSCEFSSHWRQFYFFAETF